MAVISLNLWLVAVADYCDPLERRWHCCSPTASLVLKTKVCVRVCLCVCMCHFDSQHQRSSWVEGSSSRCVGGVGKSPIFLEAALQHCHEAMAFLRTKTKEH